VAREAAGCDRFGPLFTAHQTHFPPLRSIHYDFSGLARLVGQRRSLLILDGIEPLQYAPTAPTPGELKDQGLAALLKGLAATNHGLCLVTTRYSLPDLKAFWQTTASEMRLLRLSRDAGVHLLQTLGVRGTTQEIETLVEDVKGHPLTLTLLGSYLRDAHGGDIRKRDLVKLEQADAGERGGHAFGVVDAYAKWLAAEGSSGRQALEILRLLGLSDQPIAADQVDELLKPPAISGLTESLVGIDEAQRQTAMARLEAAQLLIVNRGSSGEPLCIDSHPLIRAYFSAQLRKDNPNGLREGLNRLEAYESQLKQRATPLRLYFESERFTADEIAEILGYFSDYHEAITGDRLVIESHGTLETSGVLVPQGA
jgi:hypothetical protein